MPPYRGVDLLGLDDDLSTDERQVRDAVRAWVEAQAAPAAPAAFEAGELPRALIEGMASLGIFGAHLEGYGCAGVSPAAYGLIMAELERADSGLRSFASVQSSLAMTAIHSFGTEEQKRRYLPLMAEGRVIGCFGLTEADHGSDPAGMETRAVKTASGYRLSGSKYWITNAPIADVMVIWAKLDEQVRGFLVDPALPGVSTEHVPGKLSMRMSVTGGITLDEVELGEDALLPASKGLGSPLSCLNSARYSIAWGVCGAMADSIDTTLAYALGRTQFGRPLAGFQLVQAKLADAASALSKAQLLALRLAQLKVAGKLHFSHISMAKYSNTRAALEVARTCRDLLGAAGITTGLSPLRHALNLETVHTYEGTEHMHQLILGRHLTGLNAIS